MLPITLTVNGRRQTVDVAADTPLLWCPPRTLGLTGTKFGCGVAQCGACTVTSAGCQCDRGTFPISAPRSAGSPVTTIEGLSPEGLASRPTCLAREEARSVGYANPG